MINRELIRLKVVQLIYAYYRSERTEDALENAEKELFFSFDKSYELYLYLLNALLQLKKVAESKEETRQEKLDEAVFEINKGVGKGSLKTGKEMLAEMSFKNRRHN